MINYQSILTAENTTVFLLGVLFGFLIIGCRITFRLVDEIQKKFTELNKRVARMEGSNTKNYL